MNFSSVRLSDNVIFHQALQSFNQAKFFDAHELFEELWRVAPEVEKLFWQGLTQVCVALHHESTGNRIGAASVLNRAIRNLSNCSDEFAGLQLRPFRESLEGWSQAFADGTSPPPLPILLMTKVAEHH